MAPTPTATKACNTSPPPSTPSPSPNGCKPPSNPKPATSPPPLDAIWARYPYLHNNSIPTLCALLTPESRPLTFRQGPSEDPDTDFDPTCVGYPTGDAIPPEWEAIEDSLIDTTRPGLSNQGHTLMLDGTDGTPPITPDERADLIEFLKTL